MYVLKVHCKTWTSSKTVKLVSLSPRLDGGLEVNINTHRRPENNILINTPTVIRLVMGKPTYYITYLGT